MADSRPPQAALYSPNSGSHRIHVKHLITAGAAAALLAALVFVAGGYVHTRQVERRAADLDARVRAMSMQDLAVAIAHCDAPRAAPAPAPQAAFCAQVARELDDRPLEMVALGSSPSRRDR